MSLLESGAYNWEFLDSEKKVTKNQKESNQSMFFLSVNFITEFFFFM